jgi:hypothetical protein
VQQAMQRAFEKSARLEWMFWDSAYRLEGWPPTSPAPWLAPADRQTGKEGH